jgi:hypothetical protein
MKANLRLKNGWKRINKIVGYLGFQDFSLS